LVSRGCRRVCGPDAETVGEVGRGLCSPDLIRRPSIEKGRGSGFGRASPPPRGVQADVARARWGRRGRVGGQGARGPSRPRARDAGAAGSGGRGPAEARGPRPERGAPGAAPAAGARRRGKPGPSACSPSLVKIKGNWHLRLVKKGERGMGICRQARIRAGACGLVAGCGGLWEQARSRWRGCGGLAEIGGIVEEVVSS